MSDPLAVVIVGIGGWEEWTSDAMRSFRAHNPDTVPILIDNGSAEPYPPGRYTLIRTDETVCYSAAINIGMRAAGDCEWLVVLNNDITVTGNFRESLDWMAGGALWGNQLITAGNLRWLGLWLFAIPRHVRETVGEFDENFAVCGFDDLDYCLRAVEAGFAIEKCELPVRHHWGKTRWGIPGYDETRLMNLAYLEEKHGLKVPDRETWRVFN